MPIKCELRSDRDRGPGYGMLTITGVGWRGNVLQLVIMRNQGAEPYLAPDGRWQGNETLLVAQIEGTRGNAVSARVGPALVDAIVALPVSVAYRVTVVADEGRFHGTLKVNHPLLGSRAAAPDKPRPPKPPPPPAPAPAPVPEIKTAPPAPEPAPETPPAVEPPPLPEDAGTNRGWGKPQVAIAVLLIALAGAYHAWANCMIPGFGPAQCLKTGAPSPSEVSPSGSSEELAKPDESPVVENAIMRTCKGQSAADCFAGAASAEQTDIELARQLYQQAARMGSVDAMLRVGEMYDPDGWSTDASPEASPDWETAAYWYEQAAERGNTEGLARAGRVLCGHAGHSLEIRRGAEFLERAIAAGAPAETPALLSDCRSRLP